MVNISAEEIVNVMGNTEQGKGKIQSPGMGIVIICVLSISI